MEISAKYQGTLRCKVVGDKAGKEVFTDVAADHGGLGEHFSPVELVLAALGACVESMVSLVGERSGVDTAGLEVLVSGDMVAAPARRIGSVKVTVKLPGGANLAVPVRQKLEAAAHSCPVKNSLTSDIAISVDFIYG
jgi:putative redox protein